MKTTGIRPPRVVGRPFSEPGKGRGKLTRNPPGVQLVKIYTRTGDDGQTHLCIGPRVLKDDPHVEACGAVDELNAMLGLARAESLPADVDQLLHGIQHELFGLGADLATPGTSANSRAAEATPERSPPAYGMGLTTDQMVQRLEQAIDTFEAEVPPLRQFILPGGVRSAALLHVARTVCRRAERRVVSLTFDGTDQAQPSPIIRYLNRLGDLLFVLPRVLNARADVPDEGWQKG